MIIKSNKKIEDGMIKTAFEGDYLKVTHIQNVTPILEAAWEARQAMIGASRRIIGDGMEHIAYIPESVMAEHPEFWRDPEAMRKWLKSDEGQYYRTSTRSI